MMREIEEPPDEEPDQHQRVFVGVVQIVDHHDDGSFRALGFEELGDWAIDVVAHHILPARSVVQRAQRVVPGQPGEDLTDRGVRDGALDRVGAAPGDRVPVSGQSVGEVPHEVGLADAGLTADEHGTITQGAGTTGQRQQFVEFPIVVLR